MKKVFIDGKAGTTGLRIFDRLQNRSDITLITLPEEKRKDFEARKEAINSSDVTFLCLPDDAAREAVAMASDNVTIIDASTAHRTLSGWAYGLPELGKEFRDKVQSYNRIAVPGCHASGFISLVYPLVESGVITKDAMLNCFSLTGYSGGGKKMIEEYEGDGRSVLLDAPRQYGITQNHKHLKEMKAISNLNNFPVFCPIVSDFYSGMEVTVPLFKAQLSKGDADYIKKLYKEKYDGEIVKFVENCDESGFMSSNLLSGKDGMQISVGGNEDRILLVARYDNLGKGASGAALQCMNISLGYDEKEGLNL